MAIDFTDITHSVQMGVLWTVLEPELAIICANMPPLKPILSRMFPKLFPSSSHNKSYGVSDPYAFERLPEHAIYPLNRMGNDPLKTEVSGGRSLGKNESVSIDEESRELNPQLRDHALPPDGINVTHDFNVQYH